MILNIQNFVLGSEQNSHNVLSRIGIEAAAAAGSSSDTQSIMCRKEHSSSVSKNDADLNKIISACRRSRKRRSYKFCTSHKNASPVIDECDSSGSSPPNNSYLQNSGCSSLLMCKCNTARCHFFRKDDDDQLLLRKTDEDTILSSFGHSDFIHRDEEDKSSFAKARSRRNRRRRNSSQYYSQFKFLSMFTLMFQLLLLLVVRLSMALLIGLEIIRIDAL